jgi:hypothetical protein
MRTAIELLELLAISAVAFVVIIGFPLGLAWLIKWSLS